MQIQEQYSKNNHVINSEWGREGIFMSFSLIRTLHLHSEESGWIPRSSGSWLSDLRLCNLLICLNFCFHICKMGMIVPSLSTSQGLLGNPREKQPLFIKKKKKKLRNWCFHGTCHMPDTVWFSQEASEGGPIIGPFVGVVLSAQRGYLTWVSVQSWKNKELGFGSRLDQCETPWLKKKEPTLLSIFLLYAWNY